MSQIIFRGAQISQRPNQASLSAVPSFYFNFDITAFKIKIKINTKRSNNSVSILQRYIIIENKFFFR